MQLTIALMLIEKDEEVIGIEIGNEMMFEQKNRDEKKNYEIEYLLECCRYESSCTILRTY